MRTEKKLILLLLLLSSSLLSCASSSVINGSDGFRKPNRKNAQPIDFYRLEAAYRIDKIWNKNKVPECSDDSLTSLIITILPDGEIDKIVYVDKSECEALNESAYIAIMEAAPFEPFSKGLNQNNVKLGLRFSPKRIQ